MVCFVIRVAYVFLMWWNDMKRDIADFVAKCPNCQQVKVEHKNPGDSTEDYNKLYINDIVKLYGVSLSIISDRGPQFTSNFWISFQKGLGTHVNLSTTFHPQIDDVRRKDLEFEIDDWVFLKVSPMKGVMRFDKKGKLSPRYVGPHRILKRPTLRGSVVAKATWRSTKWKSHRLVDILGSPTYWKFGRAKSGLADPIDASPNAQPHRLVDLPP
ncbi:hypothetical protein MTR67_026162 [Solanum verrucosum]|uniref:Integrase catalytic domain-containing protein n=1 Tax=Solanum verrucosum TaxID=315347 RepID=A0AAF0R2F7_SOLVR|nr:hypothetical protein MTR67_026162 [Solanum verrucosum]